MFIKNWLASINHLKAANTRKRQLKTSLAGICSTEKLEERMLLSAASAEVADLDSAAELNSTLNADIAVNQTVTANAAVGNAVASSAVSVPTITSPGSTTSDTTPTVRWTTSSGAARYQLFVADVNTGRVIVNRYVNGTSYTIPSALTEGHHFRAWVRAFNSSGAATHWSAHRDFRVQAPRLTTPSLTSPGSTTADTTPTIRWTTSSGAARYQLFVADVNTGSVIVNRYVNGTSYTIPSSLTEGHQYRAWVRAFSSSGTATNWSANRDFRVQASRLTTPSVTSPGSTTTDTTPTIRWTTSSGAARYQLFVADVNTGRVIVNRYVNGTSYTIPSALTDGHNYRVWVRAFSASGTATNWSAYRDFGIRLPRLTTPRLTSPGSTTTDTTPTIRWTSSSGAARYQLFVADVNTGKVIVNRYVNGTSYTIPSGLTKGHTYRVWVRALSSSGTATNWSSYRDVRIQGVELGKPQPSLASGGRATKDVRPRFTWRAVTGASRYSVQIVDTFTSTTVVNTTVSGTSYTSSANLVTGTHRIVVRALDSRGQSGSAGVFYFNVGSADRILYVNFAGARLSGSQLVRWSNREWYTDRNGRLQVDPEGDGITVYKYRRNDSNRERYIREILRLVQEDFRAFGVRVVRHNGLAATGVGATTIFVGNETIKGNHGGIATSVDYGNNNLTDVAFARDQDQGNFTDTVRVMADVIAHEAGHTYGLFHTNTLVGSSVYGDIMGYLYTINDLVSKRRASHPSTYPNTSFVNRTFREFENHGPTNFTDYQNSFVSLQRAFSGSISNRRFNNAGALATADVYSHSHSHGAGVHDDHEDGIPVGMGSSEAAASNDAVNNFWEFAGAGHITDELFAGRSENHQQESSTDDKVVVLNATVSSAVASDAPLRSDRPDDSADDDKTHVDRDAAFAAIISLDGLEDALVNESLVV